MYAFAAGSLESVHSNVVTVFIIEHVIGAIAIAAVLSTALSLPGFQLNAAWINVYVSFLFLSASYLMLVVFGQAYAQQPDYSLCLVQASLVYSALPLVTSTLLALSTQVWMKLDGYEKIAESIETQLILFITPYVLASIIFINSFVIGLSCGRNGAHRATSSAYCSIEDPIPQRLSTAAVGLTALCLLIVLGRSAVRLRQIRPCDSIVPATVRHWARAALCRMGCLGLGSMVGIVFCIISYRYDQQARDTLTLMIGLLPLQSALILGSHKEIIHVWTQPFRQNNDESFKVLSTMTPPLFDHI